MSLLGIVIDGDSALQSAIKNLEYAVDNMTPTLDQAAAVLFNRMRTRYLAQVDPTGVPWQVSKAALYRAKIGRGGGTLFDTGRLFHSLQLFSIDSNTRAIGTDVPYGIYHNEGTERLPKREFLGFSDEDMAVAASFVIKRIEEALTS
jgi:phage virion morphogenesis protein